MCVQRVAHPPPRPRVSLNQHPSAPFWREADADDLPILGEELGVDCYLVQRHGALGRDEMAARQALATRRRRSRTARTGSAGRGRHGASSDDGGTAGASSPAIETRRRANDAQGAAATASGGARNSEARVTSPSGSRRCVATRSVGWGGDRSGYCVEHDRAGRHLVLTGAWRRRLRRAGGLRPGSLAARRGDDACLGVRVEDGRGSVRRRPTTVRDFVRPTRSGREASLDWWR